MKILLPEIDWNATGGGWSFARNFVSCMADYITPNYDEADIFFLPSASMVSRDVVEAAKEDGKKIVLRCDNVIRNSRNRNTGMSKMKDFADWADLTVFQSRFAEGLLNPYLHNENYKVILNSCDQSVFNDQSRNSDGKTFLYSKHSSDETKNWEMARMTFQRIWEDEQDTKLNLVGRYEGNVEEYNFDFYNGENFQYHGLVSDPVTMANIYKTSDWLIYTYFQDACSNTLIEALCCGMKLEDMYGMSQTGGSPEILTAFKDYGSKYFSLDRMRDEYVEAMEKL